ncbi:MAG: hypothetical protein LQ349_005899 [Xanthoria aureola]|nr:MAG: hypothetical protein LQ349_005899 [Xanthoria aureola]
MSVSPPKEDVEHGGQSRENSEPMDRGDPEAQARELAYEFEVKEQDRWLPIANVARIMKTALPENAKIAKEAKECMQECVSEFISFITSEASEKCQQEKRKTVNGEDILFAMTSLGFENYAEALKIYLSKYREARVAFCTAPSYPPVSRGGTANDRCSKTQSARGENQQRPGSGYGSQGAQPGPSSGNLGPGATAPSTSTGYPHQGEGVNSILSPHTLEGGETENAPYGQVYPPGASNNGLYRYGGTSEEEHRFAFTVDEDLISHFICIDPDPQGRLAGIYQSRTEDIIFIYILADQYLLEGKGPPAWEKYVEHRIL